MNSNSKSDVKAKVAYVERLKSNGYSNPTVIASPADITAEKNGYTWYFEIKKTSQKKKYFGAATLTEWIQALKDPDHFRFVVARESTEETFDFFEYTNLWKFLQFLHSRCFSILIFERRLKHPQGNPEQSKPLKRDFIICQRCSPT